MWRILLCGIDQNDLASEIIPPFFISEVLTDPQLSGRHAKLEINSGMVEISKAMQNPTSTLEVKDRLWMKLTIKDCFLGEDLVQWIIENVNELQVRITLESWCILVMG